MVTDRRVKVPEEGRQDIFRRYYARKTTRETTESIGRSWNICRQWVRKIAEEVRHEKALGSDQHEGQ